MIPVFNRYIELPHSFDLQSLSPSLSSITVGISGREDSPLYFLVNKLVLRLLIVTYHYYCSTDCGAISIAVHTWGRQLQGNLACPSVIPPTLLPSRGAWSEESRAVLLRARHVHRGIDGKTTLDDEWWVMDVGRTANILPLSVHIHVPWLSISIIHHHHRHRHYTVAYLSFYPGWRHASYDPPHLPPPHHYHCQ